MSIALRAPRRRSSVDTACKAVLPRQAKAAVQAPSKKHSRQDQKGKRRRSEGAVQYCTKDVQIVGSSEARRAGPKSDIDGVDLTWQQRELLRNQHSSSRRRSFSAVTYDSVSHQEPNLPALRVTSQGELVLAITSERPRRKTARRSLPNQHTLQAVPKGLHSSYNDPSPDHTLTSTIKRNYSSSASETKPRCSGRPFARQGEAYAEPSCFRAPPPQSLPSPCFPRSLRKAAVSIDLANEV